MSNEGTRKAKVKVSGKTIEVYRHRTRSTWVDFNNSRDEYKEDELTFLS